MYFVINTKYEVIEFLQFSTKLIGCICLTKIAYARQQQLVFAELNAKSAHKCTLVKRVDRSNSELEIWRMQKQL